MLNMVAIKMMFFFKNQLSLKNYSRKKTISFQDSKYFTKPSSANFGNCNCVECTKHFFIIKERLEDIIRSSRTSTDMPEKSLRIVTYW